LRSLFFTSQEVEPLTIGGESRLRGAQARELQFTPAALGQHVDVETCGDVIGVDRMPGDFNHDTSAIRRERASPQTLKFQKLVHSEHVIDHRVLP